MFAQKTKPIFRTHFYPVQDGMSNNPSPTTVPLGSKPLSNVEDLNLKLMRRFNLVGILPGIFSPNRDDF